MNVFFLEMDVKADKSKKFAGFTSKITLLILVLVTQLLNFSCYVQPESSPDHLVALPGQQALALWGARVVLLPQEKILDLGFAPREARLRPDGVLFLGENRNAFLEIEAWQVFTSSGMLDVLGADDPKYWLGNGEIHQIEGTESWEIPGNPPQQGVFWPDQGFLLQSSHQGTWELHRLNQGILEEVRFPVFQAQELYLLPNGSLLRRQEREIALLRNPSVAWQRLEGLPFSPQGMSLDPAGLGILYYNPGMMEFIPTGDGPLKAGVPPAQGPFALMEGGEEVLYWDQGWQLFDLGDYSSRPWESE